jgi:hypothetical protein
MKRAFALACLLLAGCANWSEESARYAGYGEFRAGKFAASLPPTLVPISARDIVVTRSSDSKDIDATFRFDYIDAERVIRPFRSPDQIRLHELEREGSLPPGTGDPSFVRCSDAAIEYLQIKAMRSAHYWTRHDPELRRHACPVVARGPTTSA